VTYWIIFDIMRLAIVGVFAKLRKATINIVISVPPSVRPSFRPHGTSGLPLDGIS